MGVFASKYNFGISNSRYETVRGPIAACSKRKSACLCIYIYIYVYMYLLDIHPFPSPLACPCLGWAEVHLRS